MFCLLLASGALAQTAVKPFDLERFSLNPGAEGSLLLGTGKTLPGQSLRLSLTFQYQHDPLVYFVDGQRMGAVVGSRLTAHLAASYGITDWFELGFQLPIVVTQSGDDLTGQGIARVQSTGLGAPIVQGQFSFLRQSNGAPLDLGLVLGVSLPLGSAAGLSRDPGAGFAFLPGLGVGHSFGRTIRLGAQFGAVVRGADILTAHTPRTTDEIGSMFTAGLVASTLGDGLRGELDVRALIPLSRTSAGVEILGGVRYRLATAPLELYALAGPGVGQMPGTPLFRALVGVAFTPDFKPRCVEGKPYELSSCPALDRDADGLANSVDRCPEQWGPRALDGCADRDDDGDGVLNLADRCPAVRGTSADGCMPPVEPDTDGDELPDSADACPTEKGSRALKGCPDADGDGIADRTDKCPAEKGELVDEGCPRKVEPELVVLEGEKISIKDQIYFGTGTAELLGQSHALLSQVATVLKDHPELTHVSIEGHTDNQGPREFNLKLSQARADSVRRFLEGQGVDSKRLVARGFGPDRPIAPNTSASGREKNRRVEFMSAK